MRDNTPDGEKHPKCNGLHGQLQYAKAECRGLLLYAEAKFDGIHGGAVVCEINKKCAAERWGQLLHAKYHGGESVPGMINNGRHLTRDDGVPSWRCTPGAIDPTRAEHWG